MPLRTGTTHRGAAVAAGAGDDEVAVVVTGLGAGAAAGVTTGCGAALVKLTVNGVAGWPMSGTQSLNEFPVDGLVHEAAPAIVIVVAPVAPRSLRFTVAPKSPAVGSTLTTSKPSVTGLYLRSAALVSLRPIAKSEPAKPVRDPVLALLSVLRNQPRKSPESIPNG